MTRVVCPICRTGFEAAISRENFALNCVSCGVAFNAASFLSKDDFAAKAERRPKQPEKAGHERGTAALGNVIRPVEPPPAPVFRDPATDGTRTSGLPFMQEEEEPRTAGVSPATPVTGGQDARGTNAAISAETLKRVVSVPTPPPSIPINGAERAKNTGLIPAAASQRKDAEQPLPPAVNVSAPAPAEKIVVPAAEKKNDAANVPAAAEQKNVCTTSAVYSLPKSEAPKPVPVEQPRSKKRPPLLEGSFGPYDIEGEIARGGVGAVFLAIERSTGRKIALKVLLEGEDAGEAERERFRHECETAKALSLPGMVTVYEVGELDRRPYMAMELVEGKSLDKVIPEKSLSVNDCLVLMKSVAETIGALHEAGYVHRDIKPGNILIDAIGSPKVADFGLVKSLDEITRLTASGLVCGTPAYMAPEQARGDGKAVDPRSDVWALGAVLYEMLCSRPPFQAENALRLMRRITEDTPTAPRLLNLKVPQDVHDIVMKCLDKNPARRYANARAMAEDITRFLNGEPLDIRTPPKMQQLVVAAAENYRAVLAIGGAVAAIVVIAVIARVFFAPQESKPLVDKAYAVLADKNVGEAQRLDDAEKLLKQAMQLDPNNGRAHLGLGLVLGRRAIDVQKHSIKDGEKLADATRYTNRAAQLEAELSGDSHAQLACFSMWLKQHVDEAKAREKAVESNPANLRFREALGLAYWNAGAQTRSPSYYKRAVQEFQNVLSADPAYPRLREYIKVLQERFIVQQPAASQAELSYNPRRG